MPVGEKNGFETISKKRKSKKRKNRSPGVNKDAPKQGPNENGGRKANAKMSVITKHKRFNIPKRKLKIRGKIREKTQLQAKQLNLHRALEL
eukprot:Seg1976.3 transcript_id=Seg1976.3/GoldUCD/mRNA.D3Y31 product="hypothetical protein" protein_id=Seg1976.3/GoldUCD/D3Y31